MGWALISRQTFNFAIARSTFYSIWNEIHRSRERAPIFYFFLFHHEIYPDEFFMLCRALFFFLLFTSPACHKSGRTFASNVTQCLCLTATDQRRNSAVEKLVIWALREKFEKRKLSTDSLPCMYLLFLTRCWEGEKMFAIVLFQLMRSHKRIREPEIWK